MSQAAAESCVDRASLEALVTSLAKKHRDYEERRADQRFWLGLEVSISIENSKGELVHTTDAWAADMSLSGICLLMDPAPERGDVLYVGLESVLGRRVYIKASVARIRKILPRAYSVGATFCEID